MATTAGEPYGFPLKLSLNTHKKGEDPEVEENPEVLERFLRFLQKNHELINKFLRENYDTITLQRYEVKTDEDGAFIKCHLKTSALEGLKRLSKDGNLSSNLTTWFGAQGLNNVLGSRAGSENLSIDAEISKNVLTKATKHFKVKRPEEASVPIQGIGSANSSSTKPQKTTEPGTSKKDAQETRIAQGRMSTQPGSAQPSGDKTLGTAHANVSKVQQGTLTVTQGSGANDQTTANSTQGSSEDSGPTSGDRQHVQPKLGGPCSPNQPMVASKQSVSCGLTTPENPPRTMSGSETPIIDWTTVVPPSSQSGVCRPQQPESGSKNPVKKNPPAAASSSSTGIQSTNGTMQQPASQGEKRVESQSNSQSSVDTADDEWRLVQRRNKKKERSSEARSSVPSSQQLNRPTEEMESDVHNRQSNCYSNEKDKPKPLAASLESSGPHTGTRSHVKDSKDQGVQPKTGSYNTAKNPPAAASSSSTGIHSTSGTTQSYSDNNGTKASSPSTQNKNLQVIKKSFCLFIPQSVLQGYKQPPSQVSIVFQPEQPAMNEVVLTQDKTNQSFWSSCVVDLSVDISADLSYSYVVLFPKNKNWFLDKIFSRDDFKNVSEKDSIRRPLLADVEVHRDTFLCKEHGRKQQDFDNQEGFIEHVHVMLDDITHATLKQNLCQLEKLRLHERLMSENLFKEDFANYLNWVLPKASEKVELKGIFLFACLSLFDSLHYKLSAKTTLLMLQALQKTKREDLLDSTTKSITNILHRVLKHAFGQNASLDECLPYLYPFLTAQAAIVFKDKFPITLSSIDRIKPVFEYLIKCLSDPVNKGDLTLLMFVSKKVSSLPLLIEAENVVIAHKEDVAEDQHKKLTSSIHQLYIEWLERKRRESKTNRDLDQLVDQWRSVLQQISFVNQRLAKEACKLESLDHLLCVSALLQNKPFSDLELKQQFEVDLNDKTAAMFKDILRGARFIETVKKRWEIVQKVAPTAIDLQKMGLVARDWLQNFWSNFWLYDQPTDKELNAMKKLLEDRNLFPQSQDYIKLLSIFGHSESSRVRNLAYSVIKKMDKVYDGLHDVVCDWFTKEINFIFKRRATYLSDKVKAMYDFYIEVASMPCLTTDTLLHRKLDSKVQSSLQSVSVQNLMKQTKRLSEMSSLAIIKFEEHLRILVSASGSAFTTYVKGEDVLAIEARMDLVAIETILSLQQVPVCSCVSDPTLSTVVGELLKQSSFWYKILNCQGQLHSKVKNHEMAMVVRNVLYMVFSKVQDKTISFHVAAKILSVVEENATNDSIRLIELITKTSDYKTYLRQARLCVAATEFRLRQYGTFRDMYMRMCDNIQLRDGQQFRVWLENLECRLTKDNNCTLMHTSDEQFWAPFTNMTESVKLLEELRDCATFLVLCKTCLTGSNLQTYEQGLQSVAKTLGGSNESSPELTHPMSYEEDEVNDDNFTSVSVVATFLSSEVYCKFQSSLLPFFKGEDVSIVQVCKVFGSVCEIERELSLIERHFRDEERIFRESTRRYLLSFEKFKTYRSLAENITVVLENFNVVAPEDGKLSIALSSVLHCMEEEDITLSKLHRSVEVMRELKIDDKTDIILSELSHSQNLITFLNENREEDFRNLIDAVEEHSETFVREEQVSHLIEVRRFVNPLILFSDIDKTGNAQGFLDCLKELCEKAPSDIESKLNGCNEHFHALKNLFSSVANRGEMTKDIIVNIVDEGEFEFRIYENECVAFVLHMKGEHQISKYSFQDLSDLKSRALLIINKDSCDDEEQMKLGEGRVTRALTEFIELFDLINTVRQTATDLYRSGNFAFRSFERKVEKKTDLKIMADSLVFELQDWKAKLHDSRREYPLLNYVYSDQLWTLLDFFEKGDSKVQASAILQYIHPNVKPTNGVQDMVPETNKDKLYFIGQQLHFFCENSPPIERSPVEYLDDLGKLKETLHLGEPFVVQMPSNCVSVVPTIVNLYGVLTGHHPQPHQVMFCTSNTELEEIELFLRRCQLCEDKNLFCLAHVELLPNDLQFALVDRIEHVLENDVHSSDFPLGIICEGSSSHPIIGKFSKMVYNVQPMFTESFRRCLQSSCPNTFTVTSTLPGLGKTEYICEMAHDLLKKRIHFPISGPFEKSKIISRLHACDLDDESLLHLDLGEVDSPFMLDLFIFELVVLGFVSSGTDRFALQTNYVCIEVSNTLKNSLKNALHVATQFQGVNLSWKHYENYLVSDEVTSPVQIVCHYLQAFETGEIDNSDICLTGPGAVTPLNGDCCRDLLRKYFNAGQDMAFSVLEIFLNVFADQLRKLSASQYFQTSVLRSMVDKNNIKGILVKEMLDVFTSFANRSVKCYRESQAKVAEHFNCPQNVDAIAMVDRVEGMIRWADNNHLLIIFHSKDFNTLSPLYRDCKRVPPQVSNLFETQIKRPLTDFSKVDQVFLHQLLEKIVRSIQDPAADVPQNYALTPDNLLKMVLIFLRLNVGVPVLIMGETGCGKTSLISYLAKTTGCNLTIFNIHAGIEGAEIKDKVKAVSDLASKNLHQHFWLFLDEINTCDHLGLINELLCRRTCLGMSVAPNVAFLAACNPYQTRRDDQIFTSGLEGKVEMDIRSKLVYRVHPLPEAMIDYVWDFGSLDPRDERKYIARMVEENFDVKQHLLIDLLSSSQNFIREYENNSWCVSLRDVRRCISLCVWFESWYLRKKYETDGKCLPGVQLKLRSIVLSLAHCYNSRIGLTQEREEYCKEMVDILIRHGEIISDWSFKNIIRREQEDLLDKMDLPESTAKNIALRENVFVILVCVLNKIPIFVVGKPGCSKSLSVQLLKSNLRGRDSRDKFFKLLPQLYIVSHQGSESSTSEGIIKVFNKALRYKESNKEEDVLPVVLLDEIGLAEQSAFNPLKVLHSLLEPAGKKTLDVAVIGISNWALDAAKMNRAIYLSRPEPDQNELFETALSISEKIEDANFSGTRTSKHLLTIRQLENISKAYFEYQKSQTHSNFHGLRDYYSLIKYLCSLSHDVSVEDLTRGLYRNFGGHTTGTHTIVRQFLSIANFNIPNIHIPVKDLVVENVNDKSARHLMLITHGDSALGILENFINLQSREHEIIFGSRFEEDISEDYNYRILSKIILCMERGVILVLKDLESIYGSLYDMLNQNYSYVGSKRRKHCRIALGPYSNPMCYVNDNFRCIVLVDVNKVNYSDPPFLNRFEKQLLTFKDILTDKQKAVRDSLEGWVKQMSSVADYKDTFDVTSTIKGYSTDSNDFLSSLVLHLWPDASDERIHEVIHDEMLRLCKEKLMWLFSPDGMLRASLSDSACENDEELNYWQESYFDLPIHKGLAHFLEKVLSNWRRWSSDDAGAQIVIQTRSNVTFNVEESTRATCQIEKLSVFRSEKQLANRIQTFWTESDCEILVLQCKPSFDNSHMLLAKSLIDKHRVVFKQRNTDVQKHVLILIHLEREIGACWQINFLCNWKFVYIDSLESQRVCMPSLLGRDVASILKDDSIVDFDKMIVDNLMWAFSCIEYSGKPRSMESVSHVIKQVNDPVMKSCIAQRVIFWVQENYGIGIATAKFSPNCWQVQLACNTYSILNSATTVEAFMYFLEEKVREPLAKIVFKLECFGAWTSYHKHKLFWKNVFLNPLLFPIEDLTSIHQVVKYKFKGVLQDLHFPFSPLLVKTVFEKKSEFLQGYRNHLQDENNLDENGDILPGAYATLQMKMCDIIFDNVPLEFQRYIEDQGCVDFLEDFCRIVTAEHASVLTTDEQILFAKWAINLDQPHVSLSPVQQVIQLVTNYWVRGSTVHHVVRLISECKQVASIDKLREFVLNQPESAVCDNISQQRATEHRAEPENYGKDVEDRVSASSEEEEIPATEEDLQNQSKSSNGSKEIEDDHRNKAAEGQRWQTSPEDHLVEMACLELLPNENVIQACGGVVNWQYKSNLVLFVASQVSSGSSALQLLRICNDFAVNIQIPHSLDDELICGLIKRGLDDFDHLQSRSMFDYIINLSEDLVKTKKVPQDDMQKFICLYLGRCFDCYQGEGVCAALGTFLERIAQGEVIDKELHYFGTLVDRVWREELLNNSALLADILNGGPLESYPNLQKLEETIVRCVTANNPSLAVLTCNIVEECFTQNDLIDDLVKQVFSIFQTENSMCLRLIVATSFLKFYLRHASVLIRDSESSHPSDTNYSFQQLSSILELSSEGASTHLRKGDVKLFLLKHMHSSMGMQQTVIAVKQCSRNIPGLRGGPWTEDELTNPIGFRVMPMINEYDNARAALRALLNGDKKAITDFTNEAIKSEEKTFALMSVVVDDLYLVSGRRELNTTEKESGILITEHLEKFPDVVKNTLPHLYQERKFEVPMFNLYPGVPVRDVHISSVMIHLLCMIASFSDKTSLFAKALFDPARLKYLYIPSTQEQVSKDTSCDIATFQCSCMHKIAAATPHCPICKGDLQCLPECDEIESNERKAVASTQTLELWRYATAAGYPRGMSAASFVIFRILMNGAILCGHGLARHDLTDVCSLDEQKETSHDDVLAYVEEELGMFWNILETMFALPSHRLCCFMHALLNRLQNFLTKATCSFEKPEERAEWEAIFTCEVSEMVKRRHDIINDTMRQTICTPKQSFEWQLEELEDDWLSPLFRFSPLKTVESLCGAVKLNGIRSENPFLELMISAVDDLQLLKFLLPIVNWQGFVVSCQNRTLTREHSNDTILQFVNSHSKEKERAKLKKMLTKFTDSWSELRQLAEERNNHLFPCLPMLHQESSVQECVAFNEGSSVFKAIQALVNIQNTFLENSLKMAAGGQSVGLSFLLRDTSAAALPCVPVHETKPVQVIDYSFSHLQEFLKFTQFNTAHGKGYELEFDFTAIEMEASNRLIFEKAHLILDDSFPFFSYAHDFLLSSATLARVAKMFPQEQLPNSAKEHLTKGNERSANHTEKLKVNLDIILDMLDRTGGSQQTSNTAIVEFADKWYSAMGKEFPQDLLPQPSEMSKLCHLVSIYDLLEELLCQKSENKLPDKYRKSLSEADERDFQSRLKNTPADLSKVIALLRRLIYRSFSNPKVQKPSESQTLITLLDGRHFTAESGDDARFGKELMDLFPPVIHMRHSYCVVKRLEDAIKEKRNKATSLDSKRGKTTTKRKKLPYRKT